MYKSNDKDIWRVFREHHYLSKDINNACNLYLIYWDNVLVAMASVLPVPSGTLKWAYRQHRLVVLPDYQGLGIGTKVNDFLAKYFKSNGYKYFIRTTHVRMGNHLSKDRNWLASTTNQKIRSDSTIKCAINRINNGNLRASGDLGDKRQAYSFEYVGEDFNTKEHQMIVCMGNIEKDKAEFILDNIIDNNKFPIIVSGNANWDNMTIWEQIAKERGIRTEILYINKRGILSINQSKLKKYDLICCEENCKNDIKPYLNKCHKCFTYYFDTMEEFYCEDYSKEYY